MRNFKLALKTSLIFLLLVTAITEVIVYPYFHSETYHYQDGYVRDEMAGSIDFIICGASQAQRGISSVVLDEELGVNSYNIGSPLMTLKARYYMLEKEVERNPVETVIIELCYDTMSRDRDVVGPEGDYYMLGRLTSFKERMEYFFSNARLDEYAEFYCDTLQRGLNAWKEYGKNEIGTSEHYETKGFAPIETHPIEMIAPENYNKEEIYTDVAEENMLYLNKMFELCLEKNIKVIMVATPLSDAAILSYDKLDEIHTIYKKISRQWNCEYYNFSLYKGKSEIFNDSDSFYDRNHLSGDGAEVFSKILSDIIADSIDGKDSYDLFYDNFAQAQEDILLYYAKSNKTK